MHSIRIKITAVTIAAILTSILAMGGIGILTIGMESDISSAEKMKLISENMQGKLDSYLNSLKQSVDMAIRMANDTLKEVDISLLGGDPEGDETARLDEALKAHGKEIEHALGSIAASNDADGAASLLPEVREMIQTMNQCGGFVSNAVEIGQTLSSVLLCLKNIADGGDGQSEEPALDSRMLYDYQALCEFLQNPTEAGLPAAYETARKIMDTNVEDWGANRDFVNQVVSVAEQVIGMHDGSIGKVVPFSAAKDK